MEDDVNELSLDNVVTDVNTLFEDSEELIEEQENSDVESQDDNNVADDDSKEDESQESVGDEENEQEHENPDFDETGDSSAHFYSSIASALKKDGVLENLDSDDLDNISNAEDFKALIQREIEAGIDNDTKRIGYALSYGMNPPEIVQFENTLRFLDNINPEYLKEESEQAEMNRKRLIYQDFINKGFSQDKAAKMVDKSIAAGTDIEDSIEALNENKQFFKTGYNTLLNNLRKQEEERQEALKVAENELCDTVLKTEEPFSGIKLDKKIRGQILNNIITPSVKLNDGRYYTQLQAYQMIHPNEFLHKLGVIYTLTDGFKDIDKLIGKKVKQKVSNNMKELERKLSNQGYHGSSPRYVGNGLDSGEKRSRYSLDI